VATPAGARTRGSRSRTQGHGKAATRTDVTVRVPGPWRLGIPVWTRRVWPDS